MKLKPGDAAPDFSGTDEKGKVHTLSKYSGKKLVIYFYPKDLTPACINQACSIQSNLGKLKRSGYSILGVSMDDAARHKKFKEKYQLSFPLIADTERQLIDAFGVWGPKKFMGREFDGIIRTTFIIDESGTIERIIERPVTKAHAEEILHEKTKQSKGRK